LKSKLRFSAIVLVGTFFSPTWFGAVGMCVLLHESAHMLTCRALSIPLMGIDALPWGVTAKADAIYEPASQFAVSVAGPMANFFLLFFHPVISHIFSQDIAEVFALANLANGLLNLIPALPLDGGIILKSVISSHMGFVRGFRIMLKLSALISAIIIFIGIYILKETAVNFSYIIAGVFMLWNIRHEKELMVCLKKKILTGEIKSKPRLVRIKARPDLNAIKIVDRISPSYTLIICPETKGNQGKSISQKELLEKVLKNPSITLGECIENF